MNLAIGLLLLVCFVFHEAHTRQFPQHRGDLYVKRGTFKNFGNFLKHFSFPIKRGLNLFDDRAIKGINLLASENDWLKKVKSTPGKRCANLLDESCSNGIVPGAAADNAWISGGNSPGKRSWSLIDGYNVPVYPNHNIIIPRKRCANLLDESCSNGGVPSAGGDSDWINGGNNPGKRSWNFLDDHNVPAVPNSNNIITPGKRCANLLDESCNNGRVPGAGADSAWISGGNSPGKRGLGLNLMDDRNIPFNRDSYITPGKRCANLLDESCSNGGVPSAGGDSDWINGGNNPGKRSWNFLDDHNVPAVPNSNNIITPGKRCANLLDESCSNGAIPFASADDDWISGGNSPGKRSLGLNLMDDRNIPFNRDTYITPGKRCANLLDESCSNGGVPDAGDDSDWINGGDNPGK